MDGRIVKVNSSRGSVGSSRPAEASTGKSAMPAQEVDLAGSNEEIFDPVVCPMRKGGHVLGWLAVNGTSTSRSPARLVVRDLGVHRTASCS
jgi:hypothetical protein